MLLFCKMTDNLILNKHRISFLCVLADKSVTTKFYLWDKKKRQWNKAALFIDGFQQDVTWPQIPLNSRYHFFDSRNGYSSVTLVTLPIFGFLVMRVIQHGHPIKKKNPSLLNLCVFLTFCQSNWSFPCRKCCGPPFNFLIFIDCALF